LSDEKTLQIGRAKTLYREQIVQMCDLNGDLLLAQLQGMALRRGCYISASIRTGRWILVRPQATENNRLLVEVEALPQLIPHLDQMPILVMIGMPDGPDPIDAETPMPGLLEKEP